MNDFDKGYRFNTFGDRMATFIDYQYSTYLLKENKI